MELDLAEVREIGKRQDAGHQDEFKEFDTIF
jgi:hypothetical protein